MSSSRIFIFFLLVVREIFSVGLGIWLLYPDEAGAATAKAPHYVVDCQIFDDKLRLVRKFTGKLCAFLPDGSLVAATDEYVDYLDPLGERLWRIKTHAHHQLNLSEDGKHVLLLHQEIKRTEGCRTRFDVFSVVEIASGKILREISTDSLRQEIKTLYSRDPIARITPGAKYGEPDCDFGHFNSFYEIPPNAMEKNIPALKAGNYIVNTVHGFYILDRQLTRILWFRGLRGRVVDNLHDVQVLPNGKLLVYSNEGVPEMPKRTTIHSYDPATEELRTLYPATTPPPRRWRLFGWVFEFSPIFPEPQYSEVSGGAQIVDEGILLNINSSKDGGKALLADHHGFPVWERTIGEVNALGKRDFFQQIKRVDLRDFLRNNKL